MTITSLPIAAEMLLKGAMLVNVLPVQEYKDGRKTDTIVGYKYVCVLPGAQYDKAAIKVLNSKKMIEVEDSAIPVKFIDPVAKIYAINGVYDVAISAAGIARDGGNEKH